MSSNKHPVCSLPNRVLGHVPNSFPEHLINRKVLENFLTDSRGKIYEDGLCFFRCLVHHKSPQQFEYFKQLSDQSLSDFKGVKVEVFPDLEEIVKININVYSMLPDGSVVKVYVSCKSHGSDTLYLNENENHLSYISNFKTCASKFKCSHCTGMFKRVEY